MSNGKVSISDFSQSLFCDSHGAERTSLPMSHAAASNSTSEQSQDRHSNPMGSSSASLTPVSSTNASPSAVVPTPSLDKWNPTERFSHMWYPPHPRLKVENHRASPHNSQRRNMGGPLPELSLTTTSMETGEGMYRSSAASSSPNTLQLTSLIPSPLTSLTSTSEGGAAESFQQMGAPSQALGGGEERGCATANTIAKGVGMPPMVSSLPSTSPPTACKPPYARETQNLSCSYLPSQQSSTSARTSQLEATNKRGNRASIEVFRTSPRATDHDQEVTSLPAPSGCLNRGAVSPIDKKDLNNEDLKENNKYFLSSSPGSVGREKVLSSATDTLLTSLSLPPEDTERRGDSCTSKNTKNVCNSHSSSIASSRGEEASGTVHPFSQLLSPREGSASTHSTGVSVVTSTTAAAVAPLTNGSEKKKQWKRKERSSPSSIPVENQEGLPLASPLLKKREAGEGGSTVRSPCSSSISSSLSSSCLSLMKSGMELLPTTRSPTAFQRTNMDENAVNATTAITSNNNQRNTRENGGKKKANKTLGNTLANTSATSHGNATHHNSPPFSTTASITSLPARGNADAKSMPSKSPAQQQQPQQTTTTSRVSSPTGNGPNKSSSFPPMQPFAASSPGHMTGKTNAWMQTDPSPFYYSGGANTGMGMEGLADPAGMFFVQQNPSLKSAESSSPSSNGNLGNHPSLGTCTSNPSSSTPATKAAGGRNDGNRTVTVTTTPNSSTLAPFVSWNGSSRGGSAALSIDPLLMQISETHCLEMFPAYVECCLGTSMEDYEARRQVFEDVQAMAKFQFGMKADAHVYGSVTTDLALPNSDIDLLITGYHPHSPLDAIQALSAALLETDEQKLLEVKASVMQSAGNLKITTVGARSKNSQNERGGNSGEDSSSVQRETSEDPLLSSNNANQLSGEQIQAVPRTAIRAAAPSSIFSHPTSPSSVAVAGVTTPLTSMSALLQSSLDKVVPEDEAFVFPDALQEKEQYFFPEELETAEEVYRNQIEKDYTFSTMGDYAALWQNSHSTAISASTRLSKGISTAEVTAAPVVPLMTKIVTTEKFRSENSVDRGSEKKGKEKTSLSSLSSSSSSTALLPSGAEEFQPSSSSAANLKYNTVMSNPSSENLTFPASWTTEEGKKQGREEHGFLGEPGADATNGKALEKAESTPEAVFFSSTPYPIAGLNSRPVPNHTPPHTVPNRASRQGMPPYYTFVPTLDGPLYRVQTITSARVPVIKITNKITNQRADITFGGGEHFRSLQMTRTLLEVFPPARPLIRFLKHCVGRMGIGELTPGGITSFAIYLMVRHLYNIILHYIAKRYQEFEARMAEVPMEHPRSGSGVGGAGTHPPGWSGAGVDDGSTHTPPLSSMLASSLYADAAPYPSSTLLGDGFHHFSSLPFSYESTAGTTLPLSRSIIDEVDTFVKVYYEKWGRFHHHQHLYQRLHQEDLQHEIPRPGQQKHPHGCPPSATPPVTSVDTKQGLSGTVVESEKDLAPEVVEAAHASSGRAGWPFPTSPFHPLSSNEQGGGRRRKKRGGSASRGEEERSTPSSSTCSVLPAVDEEESEKKKNCSDPNSRCDENGAVHSSYFVDPEREDGDHELSAVGPARQLQSSSRSSSSSIPQTTAGMAMQPQEGRKEGVFGFPSTTAAFTRASPPYTAEALESISSPTQPLKIGVLPTALLSSSSSSPASSLRNVDESPAKHQMDAELPMNWEEGESSLFHYEIAAMIIREKLSFTTMLRDFCAYYGFIFNYEAQGISFSSNGSSAVVEKPFICSKRGQLFHMASPFNPNYDLTARMTCMRDFQWMCEYFSSVVFPSFSFYTFLTWLHPPSAAMDLYLIRNYMLRHQSNEVDSVSAANEGGAEGGEGVRYGNQGDTAASRLSSSPTNPRRISPASLGSTTEEGEGTKRPDGGNSYYYSSTHLPQRGKHQTPPLRGKHPESVNFPSTERAFSFMARNEEVSSSSQGFPSRPPPPSPSSHAMSESGPHSPAPSARSMRRSSLPETRSSLSTDGRAKVGSGREERDSVQSPPSNLSFGSAVQGGSNPSPVFPVSPPSTTATNSPAGSQVSGKNTNPVNPAASLGPGGGGSSNIHLPPSTSSSPTGFVSMPSHSSTSTNTAGTTMTSSFPFAPGSSHFASPFMGYGDPSLQKSYGPYTGVASGGSFSRYLYNGGERGGDAAALPSRMPHSVDFVHSSLPANSVSAAHGNVNGRVVGDTLLNSAGYAGLLPMFPGVYQQYYDPMLAGGPTPNATAVGVTTNGNSEMLMMRMQHQAHHRNPSNATISTGTMGGGMMGAVSGPGSAMNFPMPNPGMMSSGGVPLMNMTPSNGMGSGGGAGSSSTIGNNTNNNSSNNSSSNLAVISGFGSPSTGAQNFSFPPRSTSNKVDGSRPRQPHHNHSHPHNSKMHLPPPPPPPLPSSSSGPHHHHTSTLSNSSGVSPSSSGMNTTNGSSTGGSKINHNNSVNPMLPSNTNHPLPHRSNHNPTSHHVGAGRKGGGDGGSGGVSGATPPGGFHPQQRASFTSGEAQLGNSSNAQGGGHGSVCSPATHSGNSVEGTEERNLVHSPSRKSKAKSKATKHHEEVSSHAMSAPVPSTKKEITNEKRLKLGSISHSSSARGGVNERNEGDAFFPTTPVEQRREGNTSSFPNSRGSVTFLQGPASSPIDMLESSTKDS